MPPRFGIDKAKLAAALLVCACFGSIHAYGVLLIPLSGALGINRASASLGYSTAILALTAGVYLNGRVSGWLQPRSRLMMSGIVSAAGLVLASVSGSWIGLMAGFGMLYGLANGVAYGASLGLAADAMPGREAKGIGLATAAYGLGAMLFGQGFALLLGLGVAKLFLALAVLLLACCCLGAVLAGTQAHRAQDSAAKDAAAAPSSGSGLLWLTYVLGAFSGLMVIAHAPAITISHGVDAGTAAMASVIVSLGSVAGGYLGGLIVQGLSNRVGLAIPALAQALALVAILVAPTGSWVLAALGMTGLCYGILISAVPAVIQSVWGGKAFARVYGRVFTAWGFAGLAGPLTAGYLFDATAGYGLALVVAATLSLLAFGLSFRIPPASETLRQPG